MSGGFENKKNTEPNLTSTEVLWVQTGKAGVLLLEEQSSAPSATTGFGKVYVKTDGNLYYLDENGVEIQLGASGSAVNFADNETPAGTVNGSNTAFTLANTPTAGSLMLFRNGVLQVLNTNYTLSGANITFTSAPLTGNTLRAWYRY